MHALLDHENTVPFNKIYKIYVVKEVAPTNLLVSEQFHINKFSNLRPTGLNIANPVGLNVLKAL